MSAIRQLADAPLLLKQATRYGTELVRSPVGHLSASHQLTNSLREAAVQVVFLHSSSHITTLHFLIKYHVVTEPTFSPILTFPSSMHQSKTHSTIHTFKFSKSSTHP